MNKKILLLITIGLFFIAARKEKIVTEQSKIQAIVNAQKILELQTYTIKNKIEEYILLKDLAKLFSATLTYFPSSGYVSLNYRGKKIYFYINKDFFVANKKRVYLTSEIVNINNRVYVPLIIFNTPELASELESDIQFQKDKRLLIINFIDNITLDYYITESYAKIVVYFRQQVNIEQNYNEKKLRIIAFDTKVFPREYNIVGGIIEKIILNTENGNSFVQFNLNASNVHIKREDYPDRISYEIIKSNKIEPSAGPIFSQRDMLKEEGVDIVSSTITTTISSSIPEKNNKIIVLDPGHGGEDPGAIGPNGTQEKDINLKIALYLKEMLEDDGYTVFLTRDKDVFMPLAERTKFANDRKADIFISIHCNASPKKTGTDNGFEVYFLSETATDPDAVATEKLENEVIKFEKQTPQLTKLQKILWSMIVNEFINESSKLCSYIANEVPQRAQIANRGVKQAGFYVLRGAQMPAVLVECAFISNPYEEIKLNRSDFQRSIANGIYAGIRNYEKNRNEKQ